MDDSISNRRLLDKVFHDIRSPLSQIHLFAEIIKRKLGSQLGSEETEYLNHILSAADKLEFLTQSLSDIQKPSQAYFEAKTVKGEDLLNEVKRELSRIIRLKEATISSDRLPELVGNPYVLSRLFFHALHYALKMGKIKPLNISIEFQFPLTFSIGVEKGEFTSEALNKHLSAFQTNGEMKQEIELDLYVLITLVDKLGGRVWTSDNSEKGMELCFSLPQLK